MYSYWTELIYQRYLIKLKIEITLSESMKNGASVIDFNAVQNTFGAIRWVISKSGFDLLDTEIFWKNISVLACFCHDSFLNYLVSARYFDVKWVMMSSMILTRNFTTLFLKVVIIVVMVINHW